MGKNTIWIISGVMLTALLALLGVQWYWTNHAVGMQEAQFRRDVQSAMHQVVEGFQDHEIFTALNATGGLQPGATRLIVRKEEHIGGHTVSRVNETRVIHEGAPGQGKDTTVVEETQVDIRADFSDGEDKTHKVWMFKGDSASLSTSDTSKSDKYALELVERMLRNPLPLHERLDTADLRRKLESALNQKGIRDRFSIRIVQTPESPEDGRDFFALLFPHDIPLSTDYLQLSFPERGSLVLQTLGLLLPTSGLLAFVVIGCFAATLLIIRRQKKLSRMKTDFINNMTHELKTPIATISLAVQALDDPDMQAAGKSAQYIGMIRMESERLQGQVERVLNAAALERGEVALSLKDIDLQGFVADEVRQYQMLIAEAGGTIDPKLPATALMVQADPVHLRGILRNLLENAIKYSLGPPQIAVRLSADSQFAWVEVADHGIGFSASEKSRIFEPFYRVSTGNVHDVKGFGLGLSYVKAMVEAQQGSISVASEAGQGSTFRFSIPLANKA